MSSFKKYLIERVALQILKRKTSPSTKDGNVSRPHLIMPSPNDIESAKSQATFYVELTLSELRDRVLPKIVISENEDKQQKNLQPKRIGL